MCVGGGKLCSTCSSYAYQLVSSSFKDHSSHASFFFLLFRASVLFNEVHPAGGALWTIQPWKFGLNLGCVQVLQLLCRAHTFHILCMQHFLLIFTWQSAHLCRTAWNLHFISAFILYCLLLFSGLILLSLRLILLCVNINTPLDSHPFTHLYIFRHLSVSQVALMSLNQGL